VVGGALAGALADASGAAACVSAGFVAASVPALVTYRALGARSLAANLALMAAAGLAVNGPYALITTAVSADLGSHRSLAGARPAITPLCPTPPCTSITAPASADPGSRHSLAGAPCMQCLAGQSAGHANTSSRLPAAGKVLALAAACCPALSRVHVQCQGGGRHMR